jgi:chemotaxis protein CheD
MTSRPPLTSRYLKPGELLCPQQPTVISTILGSCIAITLYSRLRGLGCMCHAVLPSSGGEENLKYVDRALRCMLERFDRLHVPRKDIEVKIFGGADTLHGGSGQALPREGASIGRQNIAAALALVAREGLRVSSSDLGGLMGRKLFFYSHTGEIFLKRFPIREGAARHLPARKRTP